MTGKMHSGAAKPLYQMARDLRNNATHAETILWGYLKTKPLGFKFRRQHPYSIYILDFYCHSLKLIIEVDGSIHDLTAVKENDEHREDLLQKDGLTVIRFENKQIEQSFEQVIKYVEDFIIKRKDEQKR
jgi:cyclase